MSFSSLHRRDCSEQCRLLWPNCAAYHSPCAGIFRCNVKKLPASQGLLLLGRLVEVYFYFLICKNIDFFFVLTFGNMLQNLRHLNPALCNQTFAVYVSKCVISRTFQLIISNIPVTIPYSETGIDVNAEGRHCRMCGWSFFFPLFYYCCSTLSNNLVPNQL